MVFARGHSNDSSTSLPLLASSSSSSPSPGRGYPPRPPSSSSPSPSTRRPSLLRILSKLLVPAASLTLISCVYLVVSSPPHLARERRLRPWTHRNSSNVDVFDKLTITSDDGNAKAVLIGELLLSLSSSNVLSSLSLSLSETFSLSLEKSPRGQFERVARERPEWGIQRCRRRL